MLRRYPPWPRDGIPSQSRNGWVDIVRLSRSGRGRAASVVGETDHTEIQSTERTARIHAVNGEALRLFLRNVMIFDETAYIANTQSEYGEPYTVIETDSDAVRSWA